MMDYFLLLPPLIASCKKKETTCIGTRTIHRLLYGMHVARPSNAELFAPIVS